jgi:hypothetical protein
LATFFLASAVDGEAVEVRAIAAGSLTASDDP